MNDAGYACLRRALTPSALRLSVIACGLLVYSAASARQADVAEQSVLLRYTEQVSPIVNWGPNLRAQSTPFQKEPDLGNRQVSRGVLLLDQGARQEMPFIWDYSRKVLYLDSNRNQDFTDDPSGTYNARKGADSAYSQTFTNVSFTLNKGELQRKYLCDVMLYRYGQANVRATLALRSYYSGKFALNGREWQLGINETLAANQALPPGGEQPHEMLLRPWENRGTAWNTQNGSLEGFAFPRNLYFGGKGYRVESKWVDAPGETACQLTLKERPADLGTVKVTGKFLERAVLVPSFSRQGLAAYTVVLDRPEKEARVPVGTYERQLVSLESEGVKAYREMYQNYGSGQNSLVVSADKPATFAAGGPLTNTVSAQRRGRNLSLTYRLQGGDGAMYLLVGQDRSKPPSFAISKNGRLLHSGKFQFG